LPSSTKIAIWPERCGHDLKPIPKTGTVFKLGLVLSVLRPLRTTTQLGQLQFLLQTSACDALLWLGLNLI